MARQGDHRRRRRLDRGLEERHRWLPRKGGRLLQAEVLSIGRSHLRIRTGGRQGVEEVSRKFNIG